MGLVRGYWTTISDVGTAGQGKGEWKGETEIGACMDVEVANMCVVLDVERFFLEGFRVEGDGGSEVLEVQAEMTSRGISLMGVLEAEGSSKDHHLQSRAPLNKLLACCAFIAKTS